MEWPTLEPRDVKQFTEGAGASAAFGGLLGWALMGGIEGTAKGAAVGGLGYGGVVLGKKVYDGIQEAEKCVTDPASCIASVGESYYNTVVGQEGDDLSWGSLLPNSKNGWGTYNLIPGYGAVHFGKVVWNGVKDPAHDAVDWIKSLF